MLIKVISGGQTGVDIAGVRAAKTCGIATGGWMPKGFRTLIGPKPQYARLYGMKEHSSTSYPPRTELNVQESDGTIRIARDFGSVGEKCTLAAILLHNKPYFDINVIDLEDKKEILIKHAMYWIQDNKIKVLNVAGNSEKTAPGIESLAYKFLVELYEQIQAKEVLP